MISNFEPLRSLFYSTDDMLKDSVKLCALYFSYKYSQHHPVSYIVKTSFATWLVVNSLEFAIDINDVQEQKYNMGLISHTVLSYIGDFVEDIIKLPNISFSYYIGNFAINNFNLPANLHNHSVLPSLAKLFVAYQFFNHIQTYANLDQETDKLGDKVVSIIAEEILGYKNKLLIQEIANFKSLDCSDTKIIAQDMISFFNLAIKANIEIEWDKDVILAMEILLKEEKLQVDKFQYFDWIKECESIKNLSNKFIAESVAVLDFEYTYE